MYFNNSVFNAEKMKRDDFTISNLTYLVENFKKVKKITDFILGCSQIINKKRLDFNV